MPDKTQHEKLEQRKKDGSICGVMEEKCPTRNLSQELQQQQKSQQDVPFIRLLKKDTLRLICYL